MTFYDPSNASAIAGGGNAVKWGRSRRDRYNLKTANALGISVPTELLLRADEVMQ